MRNLSIILLGIAASACGDTTPKSGVMPDIATGGYEAPTNAEAAASYMAGFHARFYIPELDYPQEIKDRMRAARITRLEEEMKVAKRRSEIMAKLALTVMATKDPESRQLLKDLKNNPEKEPDTAGLKHMVAMMEDRPQRQKQAKAEREKIYLSAVRRYKSNFRSLKVQDCRWTEMTRLIGSGHEAMALIHGAHPTHGYKCEVELKTEVRRGYPRYTHLKGFWVQTPAGDWKYYGTFKGVEVRPRLQRLNPALLRDPEGTIRRQSLFNMTLSSLY